MRLLTGLLARIFDVAMIVGGAFAASQIRFDGGSQRSFYFAFVAFAAAFALAVTGLALGSTPAPAKGCMKGAIVGGVAGHYVGHHGLLGAGAGCVIGHHEAAKHARERDRPQGRPKEDSEFVTLFPGHGRGDSWGGGAGPAGVRASARPPSPCGSASARFQRHEPSLSISRTPS